MAIEVGKNRIEALGEVEEAADLLRYYSQTMEDNDGYDHPMDNLGDAAVHTRSDPAAARRVRGDQPVQLPDGARRRPDRRPRCIAGNTVVFKPSSASPLSAVNLIEAYIDAGVPKGVVNLVMGPGETVGQALQDHPGHRRHRLHRLVRGRDAALPVVLEGLAAADASSRWAARTRRS